MVYPLPVPIRSNSTFTYLGRCSASSAYSVLTWSRYLVASLADLAFFVKFNFLRFGFGLGCVRHFQPFPVHSQPLDRKLVVGGGGRRCNDEHQQISEPLAPLLDPFSSSSSLFGARYLDPSPGALEA